MTTAQKPDALPVVDLPRMTPGIYAGELTMFPSETGKYVRLSDAKASLLAKEAECEALREDAARYRFARLGSMTALVIEANGEIRNAGHRYRPHELAMEWAEKIDAAIDAARAAADQGRAS